jgi:long-chain acyl-CoA synthetase
MSDLVSQVMIYNDYRRYTSTLVVLDTDRLKGLVAYKGVQQDAASLLKLVQKSFYAFKNDEIYGSRFPGKWIPSAFQVLPEPFSEQNRMAQLDDEDGQVQDNRALRRPHRVYVLTGGRQV